MLTLALPLSFFGESLVLAVQLGTVNESRVDVCICVFPYVFQHLRI